MTQHSPLQARAGLAQTTLRRLVREGVALMSHFDKPPFPPACGPTLPASIPKPAREGWGTRVFVQGQKNGARGKEEAVSWSPCFRHAQVRELRESINRATERTRLSDVATRLRAIRAWLRECPQEKKKNSRSSQAAALPCCGEKMICAQSSVSTRRECSSLATITVYSFSKFQESRLRPSLRQYKVQDIEMNRLRVLDC